MSHSGNCLAMQLQGLTLQSLTFFHSTRLIPEHVVCCGDALPGSFGDSC